MGLIMRSASSAICRCDGIGRRSGLKIHRWRQRTGSSPVTGTTSPQASYRLRRLFFKSHRALLLLRLLSKSHPLRWAAIWYLKSPLAGKVLLSPYYNKQGLSLDRPCLFFAGGQEPEVRPTTPREHKCIRTPCDRSVECVQRAQRAAVRSPAPTWKHIFNYTKGKSFCSPVSPVRKNEITR